MEALTHRSSPGPDPDTERPDGKVMAVTPKQPGPKAPGGHHRQRRAASRSGEEPLEVAQSRVALDDGARVHPHPEEDDVAERVVARLPSEHVQGEREHDHYPQERQLRLPRGQEERRARRRQGRSSPRSAASDAAQARSVRWRASHRLRATRNATSSANTNADWYSAPRTNPAKFSATPTPSAAINTPAMLPSPAAITIMNDRIVYGSPRYGWTTQIMATSAPAAPHTAAFSAKVQA